MTTNNHAISSLSNRGFGIKDALRWGGGVNKRDWKRLLGIILFLQLCSTWFYNDHMNHGLPAGLKLTTPLEVWAEKLAGGDSGVYLNVAMNLAQGKGMVSGNDVTGYTSFVFWGPGTPWVIGHLIRLTHAKTMIPYFVFLTLLEFLTSILIVLTAAQYTSNFRLLAMTAVLSSLLLPLKDFTYSPYVTTSDPISLFPLALMNYCLAVGLSGFFVLKLGLKKLWLPFLLAGIFLGLASLVRDSLGHFANFVALLIVLLALLKDRKKMFPAVGLCLLFLVSFRAIRAPVAEWNQKRLGKRVISTSVESSIWRDGLWTKHNFPDWLYTSGGGYGEYLDPQAAARIQQEYAEGKGSTWSSFSALIAAIRKRPWDALTFKVFRLPVLWLGTVQWPHSQWHLISIWCATFYTLWFIYLGLCLVRKVWPPLVVFAYPLFLTLSCLLIHFEFRYSFPVWLILPVVPALLLQELFTKRSASFLQSPGA